MKNLRNAELHNLNLTSSTVKGTVDLCLIKHHTVKMYWGVEV